MKISAAKKKENRQKIIQTAVDLMIEKGFRATTMRQIARRAEMGDATIYNYFPTKESILFGYYEDRMESCIEALKRIEGFNGYTLSEQLQTVIDTKLDLFLPDREFIRESFEIIFLSLSRNYKQVTPIRDHFFDIISEIFSAATEAGEIPDLIFQDLCYQLFWDYYVGIIFYWLNDTSDQFANTTILVDKSLDLAVAVLKSGLFNKAFDIMTFLFKQHILSHLEVLTPKSDTLRILKREFMGGRRQP